MSRCFGVLLLLLPLVGCGATPEIHMLVVDFETGEPISGAVVLYTASSYKGSLSGHGGGRSTLFLSEAVSDQEGNIVVESQHLPMAFGNYNPAMMLVFKPGYVVEIIQNPMRSPRDRSLVSTWEHNGTRVSLRRTKSDQEQGDAIYWAQEYAWEAYHAKPCSWKKLPRFLNAVEAEAAQWKKRHKKPYSSSWTEGPISVLIREQAEGAERRCGPVQDFFAPYRDSKNHERSVSG